MRNSILYRTVSTPLLLVAMLLAIAITAQFVGSGPFSRTIVEMFIRVMLVIGLYIFIGNSGIISFGHIGFMCIGAYATAWFTIPPMMKKYSLRGLPYFIKDHQLPFLASALLSSLLAAVFALIVGRILMRLSGIAASIATFAMLAVINTVYSNWDTVTGGTSSIVGIPMYAGVWLSFAGTVIAIIVAWLYAVSSSGLALRAARDEAIAASASGVNIGRERLIAFVVSAAVIGLCGSLYAHFLGVVNPDAFYLWRHAGASQRHPGNRDRRRHGGDPDLSALGPDAQRRDRLAETTAETEFRRRVTDRSPAACSWISGNCISNVGGYRANRDKIEIAFDRERFSGLDDNSSCRRHRCRFCDREFRLHAGL